MGLSKWLKPLFQRFVKSKNRSHLRRRKNQVAVFSASIEHLETRQLLSAAGATLPIHDSAVGPTVVTTWSTNSPAMLQIAVDAAGDYVVAWKDPNGSAIDAQRYHAAGTKNGSEFQVVSYVPQYGIGSIAVAMDARGDFVVSWTRTERQNIVNEKVFAQFAQYYKSTGVAEGRPIPFGNTRYTNSAVAMDSAGEFVVTWLTPGGDIDAQRFNSSGDAEGGAFQVNSLRNLSVASSPAIAMDNSGAIVITWSDSPNLATPGGNLPTDIYARLFNSADVAKGVEFKVSSGQFNNNFFSQVAMDATGGFVVTWISNNENGLILFSSEEIAVRVYGANGTPADDAMTVALDTLGIENPVQNPSVATDARGNFVVTWSAFFQGSWSGYAQLFTNSGLAIENKVLVSSDSSFFAGWADPVVAMTPADKFIVAWQGSGPKTGQHSIYTQSYQLSGPQVTEVLLGSGPQVIHSGDKIQSPVNSVSVVFNQNMNTATGGANSVTNSANWELTRNGVDITKLISTITFSLNPTTNQYTAVITFSKPLPNGAIQLVAKKQIVGVDGKSLNSGPGKQKSNFHLKFIVSKTAIA